jgi:hypothetical protein
MEDQHLEKRAKTRSFGEPAVNTRYVGKFAAVVLLATLLLIPLGTIQDQITRRGGYQRA